MTTNSLTAHGHRWAWMLGLAIAWGGWTATDRAMAEITARASSSTNELTVSNRAIRSVERHPISEIKADIYVNRNRTNMRLNMFADDLEYIQGVEPQADGFYDPDELKAAVPRHARYLAENITVRDAQGNRIEPEITEMISFDIPDEGIYAGGLMNYYIGYVFEYKHPEPPEFLTFQQDVIDSEFLFPAEVKMLIKQAGTDENFMAMLKPGKPETVRFDWDSPPLSDEASDRELNEWLDEQREKTLGITSYSSVYSFIYITDFEVRHEVLIPLATLATLIDFDRKDVAFLSIEEQDRSIELIEQEFSEGVPVRIDGVEVLPIFDRIDFYSLELRDFAMRAERQPISMANGRVGIIMSYRTKGSPTNVEVEWHKYTSALTTVESIVFAFDDIERTQFSLYLQQNHFDWTSPGRPPLPEIEPMAFSQPSREIPLLSIVCGVLALIGFVGVTVSSVLRMLFVLIASGLAVIAVAAYPSVRWEIPTPFDHSDAEIREYTDQVFQGLHRNLFRAFDYRHEEDIYDALATSVDGPLLRESYLQIRRSLEVQQQGNAMSRVDEVNLVAVEPIDPLPEQPLTGPGFTYRCQWNLVGTVEHWGHIHERTNQYTAVFNVEQRSGQWKITAMQVLNQEQGPVRTSLRRF